MLESTQQVGGLARTENYRGYRFDIGGHRFFTKVQYVEELWREILGEEFLLRPRLSRIYYRHRFFRYPLRLGDVLGGLGLVESAHILLSYFRWQVAPHAREETFEEWVTNRFGKRLFETFFKTYTEKVWGISCSVLKAEWAAQRIKDLSLRTALRGMLGQSGTKIRTLIEEFHYPRYGPGMLWEACQKTVERGGGSVRLGAGVERIHREGARVVGVTTASHDQQERISGSAFLTSMPVRHLIQRLDPPAPPAVLNAAAQLTYRDFLTVCLVVDREDLFPDNWIYVHEPEVRVARIQNFKNWSPAMVPDASKTSLGLEYFCNEGDDLWNMADGELVDLAKRELEKTGLGRAGEVLDGCVVRAAKAYPVYDSDYREHLDTVRTFLGTLENLQTIGRNGLHRYDNQDHAMLTGIFAARNLILGEQHDLWSVNADQSYHEELRTDPKAATPPGHRRP